MGSTQGLIGWFTHCGEAAEGERESERETEGEKDNEMVNGWRRKGERLMMWRLRYYCSQTGRWRAWCNLPSQILFHLVSFLPHSLVMDPTFCSIISLCPPLSLFLSLSLSLHVSTLPHTLCSHHHIIEAEHFWVLTGDCNVDIYNYSCPP